MENKYTALFIVAVLIKVLAVIATLVGIIVSVTLALAGSKLFGASLGAGIIAFAGIIGSLVAGILIYAAGDFIQCVMDIEENTRPEE